MDGAAHGHTIFLIVTAGVGEYGWNMKHVLKVNFSFNARDALKENMFKLHNHYKSSPG